MIVNTNNNLELYSSQDLVDSYNLTSGLMDSEKALFSNWLHPGFKILDVGVGTGRTYPFLSGIASEYVGVDYSQVMVDAARSRYPDANFRLADVTDLSEFVSDHFDAVVFSYNGIDYVYLLESRNKAFAEIFRILRPGGILILSSHNSRAIFKFDVSLKSPVLFLKSLIV